MNWFLEDINFTFSWQEQYLTRLLCSLVRYCSCHSNIKFISSHHRVISSISMIHLMSEIVIHIHEYLFHYGSIKTWHSIETCRFYSKEQSLMSNFFVLLLVSSQACLPYLKKAKNPHILNIAPPLNIRHAWFKDHIGKPDWNILSLYLGLPMMIQVYNLVKLYIDEWITLMNYNLWPFLLC